MIVASWWNFFIEIRSCGLVEGGIAGVDFKVSKANNILSVTLNIPCLFVNQGMCSQLLTQCHAMPACLPADMLPAVMV